MPTEIWIRKFKTVSNNSPKPLKYRTEKDWIYYLGTNKNEMSIKIILGKLAEETTEMLINKNGGEKLKICDQIIWKNQRMGGWR